jgi:hypothetical protein
MPPSEAFASRRPTMPVASEDSELIRHALAYVGALYRELTQENGAPALGTQNQTVDFILADPELRAVVARWGRMVEEAEATVMPPQRLPQDDAYRRIRDHMTAALTPPVFGRSGGPPRR